MRLPHQEIQQWQESEQQEQQERYLQQATATDKKQQQPYDIEDEAAVSFDGDVSFIQQLALQKAAAAMAGAGGAKAEDGIASTTNIDQGVVYPSSCESSSANSVDPQQLQQHHLEVLTWFYSVEYKTPTAAEGAAAAAHTGVVQKQSYHHDHDNAVRALQGGAFTLSSSPPFTTTTTTPTATTATAAEQQQQRSLLAKVEQVLQLRLANLILVCASVDAEFAEIVGEVSLPMDDVSEERTCFNLLVALLSCFFFLCSYHNLTLYPLYYRIV
jgi:hypothetical protein